jgi:hypothetical protein
MYKPQIFFSILIIALLLTGCAGNAAVQENQFVPTSTSIIGVPTSGIENISTKDSPASCPVTVPQNPAFTPPAPYDTLHSFKDHFWFGSNSLWTIIPANGVWNALPLNPEGYTQKILWWREGYVWDQEPEPNLIVTGERLDASAPPLNVSKATNAFASDIGSAMMVGVDFPTLGCWKITGNYNGIELSFVILVAP